ncbi:MAG: P-II family nitrogen regulator [Bacteroidales bacterium]|nr:P-II family nitrogen regulator [Bacteroidales bacterium]HOI32886.1 P-II family nitrogen regulator [Bacteroidales bacterium]
MKAIFIAYNQAHTEKVEFILDRLGIRGFTQWGEVMGRGSVDGEPRMGTHTWPEQNSAMLLVVEDQQVEAVLEAIKKLDAINKEVGVRAFVWNIETSV